MADPKNEPSTPYGETGEPSTKPKNPATGEPSTPYGEGGSQTESPGESKGDPSRQPS
jgi:hypothetical protein